MPRIAYKKINFRAESMAMIFQCQKLMSSEEFAGYNMTLRQLYYALVSRDLFPPDRKWKQLPNKKWVRDPINGTNNAEPNYDWLGTLINDARLAGYIDWESIVDRTRELRTLPHWENPSDIIEACAQSFNLNLWENQPKRVEVWIEKDALLGVIEKVCNELDVPHFSCRGYTSQSEMWVAAQRIIKRFEDTDGQETVILHLGDHDPSGIDMTRDIEERLEMFCHHESVPPPEIHRIALNMNQIRQYKPPENPAKLSDSRATSYIEKYGDSSWELDALTPAQMERLVRTNVMAYLDADQFDQRIDLQQTHRDTLVKASKNWTKIEKTLSRNGGK